MASIIKKFFSKIGEKLKLGKNLKTIIAVVLSVIVVAIFFSSFKSKSVKTNQTSTKTSSLIIEYCKEQENRLEQVLENVKGISNVKVFVYVDESPTIKYLEEKNESTSDKQSSFTTTTVLVKNGSITQPVVVVEVAPKIKGVLLIAKGAGDLKIKTTLTNIISSVLGINISNVEVLEGR